MTNQQNSKKNMYSKMLIFFADADNIAVWTAFTLLVTKIGKFVTLNGDMQIFINQQNQETGGITSNKDNKMAAMIKLVVNKARKSRVWAEDVGETDLEAVFNVHADDFKMADELAISKAKNIHTAIHDNIGALVVVNVLPADDTAIGAAILAAEGVLGTPGAAAADKKAGTDGIEVKMHEIDVVLDAIDDLLIPEYEDSNDSMVEEYKNDRKIDNTGVHHTGISAGIFYENTTDVAEGITMKIVELNKSAVSDINGIDEIIKMKAGTYHVEFSAANIITKTIIQKIPRGKIVHIHVEVRKV